MNDFALLLPCYRKHVNMGTLAHVAPLDPHLPKESLTQSLERYLVGDTHELDLETAESLREAACKRCLQASGSSGSDHFCAAVLLAHLLAFGGAGFGHTEAPLVIAVSAIRDHETWQAPSGQFLRAMYEKHARPQMGALAVYVGAAALLLENAAGARGMDRIAQELLADAATAQHELNADHYTAELVARLKSEIERRQLALPEPAMLVLDKL